MQIRKQKSWSVFLILYLSILLHAIDTSEDNTTRYWREQQARGKLQIAEETEQWA
jgi:hypothetical protein